MRNRSRRFFHLSLLVAAAFLASIPCDGIMQMESASNASDTVYITASGKRYHRKECRYAKTASPVTRAEAEAKGLTPCKQCKP